MSSEVRIWDASREIILPAKIIVFKKRVYCLTKGELIAYNAGCCEIGDIAQLGERLNGIQEVRGSNPLISTR